MRNNSGGRGGIACSVCIFRLQRHKQGHVLNIKITVKMLSKMENIPQNADSTLCIDSRLVVAFDLDSRVTQSFFFHNMTHSQTCAGTVRV